jgi:DNA repair exonuclease SbcCD ATPase subunit
MRNTIDPSDKFIDSRDIQSRIDELEAEREELEAELEEAQEELSSLVIKEDENEEETAQEIVEKAKEKLEDWDADNKNELDELESLKDEVKNCSSEWSHGVTLINDNYWTEYVQELVSDIGDMPKEIPSYIEIDWDKTAENVAADYSTVDYGVSTFYVRNS